MPTVTLHPEPTAVREVDAAQWSALVAGGELPGWPDWTVRLSCRVRVPGRTRGGGGRSPVGAGLLVDSDQRYDRGLVAAVLHDPGRERREVRVCEAAGWWRQIDALTDLAVAASGLSGPSVTGIAGAGAVAEAPGWSGVVLPPWCEVGWEWLMGLERARRVGRGDLWQELVATDDGPVRTADPRIGRWTTVSPTRREGVLRALQTDRLAEVRVLTAVRREGEPPVTGCVGWWLYPDGWRRVRAYACEGRDRLLVQQVRAGDLAGDVFGQTCFVQTHPSGPRGAGAPR